MPIRDVFDKSGKKMGEAHGKRFHPTTNNVPNSFDATDNFGRPGRVAGNSFTEASSGGGGDILSNIVGFGVTLIAAVGAIIIFVVVIALVVGIIGVYTLPIAGPIVIFIRGGWKKTWRLFRIAFLITLIWWALAGYEAAMVSQLAKGVCGDITLSTEPGDPIPSSGEGTTDGVVTNHSRIDIGGLVIDDISLADVLGARWHNHEGIVNLSYPVLGPGERFTIDERSGRSQVKGVFVRPPGVGRLFLQSANLLYVLAVRGNAQNIAHPEYVYIPCNN